MSGEFTCGFPPCGDTFSRPVWHCPYCGRHNSVEYEVECGDCHYGIYDSGEVRFEVDFDADDEAKS